ncbi:MAG: glycoside hydrolase family 26 protein, partial [Treponema sp.]|nr:glycoside hydrolase family 26 protein [Treponema sp.]
MRKTGIQAGGGLVQKLKFLNKPGASALVLAGAMLLFATCPSQPDPYVPHASYEFGEKSFSPNAQRLMDYLAGQYGEKILSGQMDTAWTGNEQMDMIARVYNDTGKYPAIKGFDFIQLPFNYNDNNYNPNYGRQQIDEAIEWWD